MDSPTNAGAAAAPSSAAQGETLETVDKPQFGLEESSNGSNRSAVNVFPGSSFDSRRETRGELPIDPRLVKQWNFPAAVEEQKIIVKEAAVAKPRTKLPSGRLTGAQTTAVRPVTSKRRPGRPRATKSHSKKQPAAQQRDKRDSTKPLVAEERMLGNQKHPEEDPSNQRTTKLVIRNRPLETGGVSPPTRSASRLTESEGFSELKKRSAGKRPQLRPCTGQREVQDEEPVEAESLAKESSPYATTRSFKSLRRSDNLIYTAQASTMTPRNPKKPTTNAARGDNKRAASTPNRRSAKKAKKDLFDDPDALMEDPRSLIYAPETNLKTVLQHPLARGILGNSPQGNQLIPASPEQLASAIALFKEDGREGRHDPEWLRQAAAASERRANGEFEAYEDARFKELWGVEGEREEYSDEEDESEKAKPDGNDGNECGEGHGGEGGSTATGNQIYDSNASPSKSNQSNGDGDSASQTSRTEGFGTLEVFSASNGY